MDNTWSLYLNVCCVLEITWQDTVTGTAVLERLDCVTVCLMLSLRRHMDRHVRTMDDGENYWRMPKDILFDEFEMGKKSRGRPLLRYTHVCKRGMIDTGITKAHWEQGAV